MSHVVRCEVCARYGALADGPWIVLRFMGDEPGRRTRHLCSLACLRRYVDSLAGIAHPAGPPRDGRDEEL